MGNAIKIASLTTLLLTLLLPPFTILLSPLTEITDHGGSVTHVAIQASLQDLVKYTSIPLTHQTTHHQGVCHKQPVPFCLFVGFLIRLPLIHWTKHMYKINYLFYSKTVICKYIF